MSEKKFDVGGLVNNAVGHPLARTLAEGLWKTNIIRRFAAEKPEMMSLISKGVMAVTSLIEVGGDHPIARFGNYLAETLATENLELLKEFRDNPNDPLVAKKVEDWAIKKATTEGVYVAFHHIHKDEKCLALMDYVADATPPARTGKDGKTFTNPSTARVRGPVPIENALAVTTALCGKCYQAPPMRKAEEADKPKAVTVGRNFMEYVWRLKRDEPREYQKFWPTYLLRLDGPDGPDLARKFQEAFNGRFDYDAFRAVVDLPHRNEFGSEEWHHALDALLGKVTTPETWKKWAKGFVDEEKRQTKEMFLALFAWVDRSNAARAKKISAKQASIAELDQQWASRHDDKPGFWTGTNIMIICLAVILAAVWMFHRSENAPARSEKSEQKVESSNNVR